MFMRALILGCGAVLLTAAGGSALLSAAGRSVDVTAVALSAAAGLAALVASQVPLLLTRGGSVGEITQGALLSTIAHIFVMALAAGAILMSPRFSSRSFVGWLLAFYWVTLLVLVFCLVRLLKTVNTQPKL